jgi:hypothetical protein
MLFDSSLWGGFKQNEWDEFISKNTNKKIRNKLSFFLNLEPTYTKLFFGSDFEFRANIYKIIFWLRSITRNA